MLQRTTAINKLLALKKRKKIIQGGTWAGKTYGIMAVLIDYAAKNPNKVITCVAETIPAIKRGALKDFKEIMQTTNRWFEERFNNTDRFYKFANGTTIEFNSFDSVGKAQAAGKRTDLFINEAPYITFEIADSLIGRTSENIWIDFNPTNEFWAHTEMIDNDADFIILKYTDNEALPDSILNELKKKQEKAKTSSYWANWCRVYIDGEIGNLDGVVFNNWQQIDSIPKEAVLIGNGLDFGFTNDPTAAIRCFKYDNKIILDEILYQQGLLNNQIFDRLKQHPGYFIADSSEPKTISELSLRGLNVIGAEKGAGSIMASIGVLQEYEMLITSNSHNLIKELRSYCWDKDKSGKQLNKPIDGNDHAINAAMYMASKFLKTKITAKPLKIIR
jgi:phage terminase large subunit